VAAVATTDQDARSGLHLRTNRPALPFVVVHQHRDTAQAAVASIVMLGP
jgi:hypothetical protein